MADENIKDFTVTWIVMGFLFFSLITFAITFIVNNNPTALGDYQGNFQDTQGGLEVNLIEVEDNVNSNINASAELSSEESTLGTQAAASTSYSLFGTGKGFFTKIKPFMSMVFSGMIGQMLIAVMGGIIGVVGTFYVIRLIRSIF